MRSGVSGSGDESFATRAPAPDPETPQTREVSWYRVVVEVALHDRLEPLSGLGHGIVHALAELLLNLSQLGSHALADRGAPHHESP